MIVDKGKLGEELRAECQPVFDGDVDAIMPMLKNETGPGDASLGWYTMYIAFPANEQVRTKGIGGMVYSPIRLFRGAAVEKP